MIKLENLVFRYHPKRPLFEQLDLNIDRPGIVGLLGSNGAGKTTLLHILAGLRFPWVGECTVLGEAPRKRRLSWQQQVLFVPETIEMPGQTLLRWLKELTPFYPRFDQLLFETILKEFEMEVPGKLNELSFGQQKKVMLAFALAAQTKLLLLDEPSNGLDVFSKSQLRRIWTRHLPEDTLVIISTHQVRELGAQFDRVIMIDQGKVLFNQPMQTLNSLFCIQRSIEAPTADAWYSEPVPGGYLALYASEEGDPETEIDLEILMKAIVEKPEILVHLQKIEIYAAQ